MNEKTGILFFSLSPEAEAQRKRWTQGSKLNLLIAQRLFKNSLQTIKQTHIPFSISTEISQPGLEFGTKISNAITTFFEKDFEHVIVIGNDCPQLSSNDILSAYENVQKGHHTIGQTKDGGSYLFTLSKKSWNPEKFKALAWCTKKLSDQLFQLLQNQSVVCFLSLKSDIDHYDDLLYFIQHSKSKLAKFFKQLIAFISNYYFLQIPKLCENQCFSAKRGPPLLLT